MPSPVAHGAVALLLWPTVAGRSSRTSAAHGVRRGALCIAGLLVMLTAPDLDFIPHLFFGDSDNPLLQHGGATHSFVAGAVAAVFFALVLQPLLQVRWLRLFVVGLAAWWSHVVMDYFTWQGGVMALWPLSEHRYASPMPLFYGARHSEPGALYLHAITLATELLFALVLWLLVRWRKSERRKSEASGPSAAKVGAQVINIMQKEQAILGGENDQDVQQDDFEKSERSVSMSRGITGTAVEHEFRRVAHRCTCSRPWLLRGG